MPEPRQRKPSSASAGATSPDLQGTPSPQLPSGDYSYTLEVVMGMQATLGRLTEAVDSLSERTKSHGEKLDHATRDIHVAKVILGIIGGLITIGITFAGIAFKAYLDHAWQKP